MSNKNLQKKNFIDILDLIMEIEKTKNKSEVGRVLGISRANLSAYEKKGTMPYPNILKYCQERNISLDWFFSDIGNQKIGALEEEIQNLLEKNNQLTKENERLKDTIDILIPLNQEYKDKIQELRDRIQEFYDVENERVKGERKEKNN